MKQLLIIALLAVMFASCEKETETSQITTLTIEAGNNPYSTKTNTSMGVMVYVNNIETFMPYSGGSIQVEHDMSQPFFVTVENTYGNINPMVQLTIKGLDMVLIRKQGKETVSYSGVLLSGAHL